MLSCENQKDKQIIINKMHTVYTFCLFNLHHFTYDTLKATFKTKTFFVGCVAEKGKKTQQYYSYYYHH